MKDLVEQQREHFEGIAKDYFVVRQNPNHLMLKKLLWDYFFNDKIDYLKKCKTVLEPMCGYSEGKKILEDHLGKSFEYEGFDYSKTQIEKAKELNPTLNIYLGDVVKFNADKKYDIIILLAGLHHVPNHIKGVLNNLHDSLNPNGYLINFEPTFNNYLMEKTRDYVYKKNACFDYETERSFSLLELNSYYSESKFYIKDQIYPGLLSYILYYNPDVFPLLNIGGRWMVKFLFQIDKVFFRNYIGKKLSLATLTILSRS